MPKGEAYDEVDSRLDRALEELANLMDSNTLTENKLIAARGPYRPTEQDLAFERQREAERQQEAERQKQLAVDRERRLAERPKKGGRYKKTKRRMQKRKTKKR